MPKFNGGLLGHPTLVDPDSPIGATLTSLPIPYPPLPFPSPSSPPPFPVPLEVGPSNTARGLGSAVSSPSGVWDRAPAEIEFGAF